MPEIDTYRLRILKTYSIMVEYEGTPHRSNVPSAVEGETFKQWKERVLGPDVSDVVVLAPWDPPSQTKMRTIQGWSNLQWPKLIAAEVATKKNLERERVVGEETEKVRKSYDDFSADTLHDVVAAMKGELHPAANEFLIQQLAGKSALDTRRLVDSLIRAYNGALCELRTHLSGAEQKDN